MNPKIRFKILNSHMHKMLCVCALHVMVFSTPAFSQTCSSGACSFGQDHTVGSTVSSNAAKLSTSGLANYLNNVEILICGDFTVDESFTLVNSTIVLTEDSELIIESSNRLISYFTTYQGCDGMWKGIRVEGNAMIHSRGSHVLDAYVAGITTEESSTLRSYADFFGRNHISISIPDGTADVFVLDTEFSDDAFLWNFPSGLSGNNDGNPWIAIDIHNASVTIGDARYSSLPNEIDGEFEFGVRMNNSVVKVENTNFSNMAYLRGNTFVGTGIYFQNGSLATIVSNDFENIHKCIYTQEYTSRMEVRDNSFKDYDFGVSANFSGPATGLVQDNQIGTSIRSGKVAVQMFQVGTKLQTLDNTIFVDSRDGFTAAANGGMGIKHHGSLEGVSEIKNNDLTLKQGSARLHFGILVDNQNGTEVFNNSIEIDSDGNEFFGIYTRDADFVRIEENSIVADQKGTNVGMRILDSDHLKYCCNYDSLMDKAVLILENCDGSDFSANEIYQSNVGLEIEDGGFLGVQELKGNRWRQTFSDWGAINQNTEINFINSSRFEVNDIDQPDGPGTLTPVIGWFAEDNSTDDKPCGAFLTTECGDGPPLTPSITTYDTLFAAGAMDTLIDDGSAWMSAQRLFSKMTKDGLLYGDYDVTDDWYDNQINEVVEDYYLLNDTINRLFRLSTSQEDTIERSIDTIEKYFDDLRYIDSLIEADTISNWHLYDTMRSDVVHKIDSVYGIYQNAFDNIFSTRKLKAQNLVNTNSQLSTPDLPTRYERMFNDIFLETVASNIDTFTVAQKDSLYVMATQCPRVGGRAVYWSASLYQLIEDVYFDTEANCNTSQSVVSKTNEVNRLVQSLIVVPSPAQDYIELAGLTPDESKTISIVRIFNLAGAQVFTGSFGLSNRIDIAHLSGGMYIVIAETKDQNYYRAKFVIQR